MSVGATYFGTVKAVLTGDTLVVLNNANQELTISLSNIQAPNVSKHPDQSDEPLGFLARETLRKVTIGKRIMLRIDYDVNRNNFVRKYASVWLATDPNSPPQPDIFYSINNLILVTGMGKLFYPNDAKTALNSHDAEVLSNSHDAARRDSKGIHGDLTRYDNNGKRIIRWIRDTNEANQFIRDLHHDYVQAGNTIDVNTLYRPVGVPAIIEQVITGNTYRVFVPSSNVMVTVVLAGTSCPGLTKAVTEPTKPTTTTTTTIANAAAVASNGKPPVKTTPDELGVSIQKYSDQHFLQHDITLYPQSADDKGRIIGILTDTTNGDIGLSLITLGYVRMFPRTETYLSEELRGQYRPAERQAKTKRLGVWKDFEDRTPINPHSDSFKGQIVEVHGGDSITILLNPNRNIYKDAAIERRVWLSSIQAPLAISKNVNRPANPKAAETVKEYLRSHYIGKTVHADVDYTRDVEVRDNRRSNNNDDQNSVSTTAATRTFATVVYTTNKGNTVDIGMDLIRNGLVDLVFHKQGELRSRNFDELQAARTEAKSKSIGIHNTNANKNTSELRIESLDDKDEAIKRFEYLRREKQLVAVVEHVVNAGRMRLYLPNQYLKINFAVSAVQTPSTGRYDQEPEAYAAEGKAYARQHLLQKRVEVIIESVDKSGKFLGCLWVGEGGQRYNYAVDVIRKGLGYVMHNVARNIYDGDELAKAENEAKSKKVGVWENYVPPVEEEDDGTVIPQQLPSTTTQVDDNSMFKPANKSGNTMADLYKLNNPSNTGTTSSTATVASPKGWNTPGKLSLIGTSFNCIVTYVQNTTCFYINRASDSENLDAVNSHLDSLFDQYGTAHASLGGLPETGKLVACLWSNPDGSGDLWTRARIEGQHKKADGSVSTVDGLTEYNVMYIDIGERSKATIHRMRPLDASIAAYPPFAIECSLPYLRYPDEYTNDIIDTLQDCVSCTLQCTVYGQMDNKKLLVDLVDTEKDSSLTKVLVSQGYARLSRTETNAVKFRARIPKNNYRNNFDIRKEIDSPSMDNITKAQLKFIIELDEAQQQALKDREGIWHFGDIGDSETDDKQPTANKRR